MLCFTEKGHAFHDTKSECIDELEVVMASGFVKLMKEGSYEAAHRTPVSPANVSRVS